MAERPARYNSQREYQRIGDTALELIQSVGRHGWYYLNGLDVEIEVLDARISWGKPQYLITPVAGFGSKWVETGLRWE